MRFTQSNTDIQNEATIGDGVVLDGTGIRFTNTVAGRIVGGVVFAQGGSTLVNEQGGVIRTANGTDAYNTVVVTGSDGADTVVNAGLISGLVRLGAGNDRYSSTAQGSYADDIDMGDGDDLFEYAGSTGTPLRVKGGAGTDRIALLVGNQAVVYGDDVSGFENLAISGNGQFFGFSGYRSITLGAPAQFGLGLSDSLNPLVDLALAGNGLRMSNATLRSVTGSAADERLELTAGASIAGKVDLGGGDDRFVLFAYGTEAVSQVPAGGVEGGAGRDTVQIQVAQNGRQAHDLTRVTGFEALSINAGYQAAGVATLSNVRGVAAIDVGGTATLELRASLLPTANVTGAFGGGLTLDAGSSIGRYGFPTDGPYDQRTDLIQADDRLSVVLTNAGRISGDVVFYIGDDRYDGSAGSVGGTVWGNAGNDVLLGGVGAERFYGGAGADTLSGGGGDDRLDGGANGDRLFGGAGDDVLTGGLGNDTLDGGAGIDRAAYAGLYRTYAPSVSAGVVTLTKASVEGTDTLTGVEYIAMRDGVLVSDPDSVGAQVQRLYDTVFGRGADAIGLDHWVDRIQDGGVSLVAVADAFAAGAEFRAATGGLGNAAFVDYVYTHALGRAADADGRTYWAGRLDAGLTRGGLLVTFSEGAEHRARTQATLANGWFDTDDSYQAVALLYDGATNRLPDESGLTYWAEQVKAGTRTLAQVADAFAGSGEFAAATQGKSSAQMVDYLYANTLDRPADAAGRAYWADRLDQGLSKGALLLEFSLGAEHQQLMAPHVVGGIEVLM